jgi:hypothetical protein
MTITYEPLSADEIEWMRKYVERNPETTYGIRWGRFLETLDAAVRTERERCAAYAEGMNSHGRFIAERIRTGEHYAD